MKIASRPRPAFTLIELIVVLSIIAILATLSAAVVLRLQQSSKETNTNTHLRKIHMKLNEQWIAAVGEIAKEPIPQLVKELTKNADGTYDIQRAKAFHMKMRLRQEFPQNFGDLFSNFQLILNGQVYRYDPKPAYVAAVKSPLQPQPLNFVENVAESQSAALLYLIVSQGRGGVATDAETMARTGLLDFPQNPVGGQTPPPVQLRVFVDEWGKHIAFRRQADDYDTAILDELNQAPFVDASKIPTGNLDPQDPDGRLKKPTTAWGNVVNQNGQQENGKVVATRFLAYTNQGSRPYILDPFDGRNRGPFAFSAGKDDTFYTDNDLYSFRLAQQGRGN